MGCAKLRGLLDIGEDGWLWAVVSESGIRGISGQVSWTHKQTQAVPGYSGPTAKKTRLPSGLSKDKSVQMGGKDSCVLCHSQV